MSEVHYSLYLMKSLILAEKPSVAKEIARVIGCPIRQKGYFEGKSSIVTWALGHLVTLADPHEYNEKYREWRMDDLPMLPENMKLQVIRKTSHQFRIINHLIKRNDVNSIIIATDAGREGELVARWILKLSGNKHDLKRLWISSQTDRAIQDGFAHLRPGKDYNNLFQAAVCRAEADWLIGLNVTRALTCKFDAQFTAGRVQTPTLAMITKREKEIKNFVPEDYWIVTASFGDYKGLWKDRQGNARLFSEKDAELIVHKTMGKSGTIVEAKAEKRQEYPPLAYDLTELQRDANRRFGYSAKKTLSLLQSLYERHKLVTYPRTDSRHITTDMVPTLKDRLKAVSIQPFAVFIKPLLANNLSPGKHFVNNAKVSDHHAIIPTEETAHPEKLDSDERNIHELVVKRFIEVLYPPCTYMHLQVITEVEKERFYTRGKEILDPGFKVISSRVYTGTDTAGETDDLPEQKIKGVKKGDVRKVQSVKQDKLKTQPPSRYTEATLLTAMENAGKFIKEQNLKESIKKGGGIGTPATRADIIEKLFYNNYIERHGKIIFPTTKGMKLVKLVPRQLKSPKLTAEWELRLSRIEQGLEEKSLFLNDIRQNTVDLVKEVRESTATYKPDNMSDTPCPVCGKKMLNFKGRKGKMLVCQDRNCGFRQSERESRGEWFEKSKKQRFINKKLIEKYSDKSSDTISFGDLIKQAMEKKKKK
ncbi:MAG: DNA topoisomerase III [Spirochaetales bacterium]|nr:DNA topoisomerase III [Spirochaetales bacterium]